MSSPVEAVHMGVDCSKFKLTGSVVSNRIFTVARFDKRGGDSRWYRSNCQSSRGNSRYRTSYYWVMQAKRSDPQSDRSAGSRRYGIDSRACLLWATDSGVGRGWSVFVTLCDRLEWRPGRDSRRVDGSNGNRDDADLDYCLWVPAVKRYRDILEMNILSPICCT